MTAANIAYQEGVKAAVDNDVNIAPDKYWSFPYLAETWYDGYQEGNIRDRFYMKQLEFDYE